MGSEERSGGAVTSKREDFLAAVDALSAEKAAGVEADRLLARLTPDDNVKLLDAMFGRQSARTFPLFDDQRFPSRYRRPLGTIADDGTNIT